MLTEKHCSIYMHWLYWFSINKLALRHHNKLESFNFKLEVGCLQEDEPIIIGGGGGLISAS